LFSGRTGIEMSKPTENSQTGVTAPNMTGIRVPEASCSTSASTQYKEQDG